MLFTPESERMLREESESDSSLRAQHGAKWSRTPSDKLTATFTANANKYRTIINNATQADSMVKEKLNTHMAGMQVFNSRFSGSKGRNLCIFQALSGGESAVASQLPQGSSGSGGSSTAR